MTYDMIIIDLFIDDEIPEKFTSFEFLGLLQGQSRPKWLVAFFNWMTVTELQKVHCADYKNLIFDVVF